jgi:universal stress protein E
MKRFRNVLLVAGLEDGPIPSYLFDRALSLVRRNQAKLTLIDVVPDNELALEILPPELIGLDLDERWDALGKLVEAAQGEGVEVEMEIATGKPFLEITRRVQSSGHDLVMTDGGRGKDSRGWIDSTTMQLMRKCPCAIWVARPRSGNRYTRVLAAIDPYPADPEKSSLNRKIMELAVSMAKIEEGELHVVHAWRLFGAPVGESTEAWKQWEKTARNELKRRLHEFLAAHSQGSAPQVHLVAGKPYLAISQLAVEKQIDLLVMGTVCRTGITGFFIGNTAEGVLRRVDCSLLTVKPEGFISPVTV